MLGSIELLTWKVTTFFKAQGMRFVEFIKKRKEWAIYVSIVAVMLILVPITTVSYLKGGERALDRSASSNVDFGTFKDGVAMFGYITNVDPMAFNYRLSISLKPYVSYSD